MAEEEQVQAPPAPEARAGSHNWFQWYHVVEGDTLSEIALWWFGSGEESAWRRIWLPNRRTVRDPNQIRPSMWLKLPYQEFRYHIEQGDTLSQLAQWLYYDPNAWPIIWNRNPWIPNPNVIQRSWWIWVP
jgi:nucleoid-associated protein YgaU